MTEFPLAIKQLVNITSAELGLGESDKLALELALQRAFILGMKYAKDEYERNKHND